MARYPTSRFSILCSEPAVLVIAKWRIMPSGRANRGPEG
jgi:hypothetical protein